MSGWREWTGGPRPDCAKAQIQLRCQSRAHAERSEPINPAGFRWLHTNGPGDIIAMKEVK